MMFRRLLTGLAAISVLILPVSAVSAKGPKYAKTEVDKAVGKCIASVVGGALLGALLGRVVGGRNATAGGAVAGAAAGGVVCGVLIANAKNKDRIIQAQLAAAQYPDRPYSASWTDEAGKPVTYVTNAGPIRTIDGSNLAPVRYKSAAGDVAAPVLDTGGRECRPISGAMQSADASAATPDQLVCRTEAGDWQPYSEIKA